MTKKQNQRLKLAPDQRRALSAMLSRVMRLGDVSAKLTTSIRPEVAPGTPVQPE